MKELKEFDGIQSVSKGRYFLSPGLAPTFQVIIFFIREGIEIVSSVLQNRSYGFLCFYFDTNFCFVPH